MKDFVSCYELIHEQTDHSQAVITTESSHEKIRSVAFAHWFAVVPPNPCLRLGAEHPGCSGLLH
jgi:hypothetical protein